MPDLKQIGKEGAELLINEAINKIPGASVISRIGKYIAKRVAAKAFRNKH